MVLTRVFIGYTLDVLGKVILGLTVIMVHRKMIKERKFDKKVIVELQKEQLLGLLGIVLIIVGYFLQVPAKLIIP